MGEERRKNDRWVLMAFTVVFAVAGWFGTTLWGTVLKVNTLETNYLHIITGLEEIKMQLKDITLEK